MSVGYKLQSTQHDNSKRMWLIETLVFITVIYMTAVCESQVQLNLCRSTIKHEPCELTCTTPDLLKSIYFKRGTTEYAKCELSFGPVTCSSTIGAGYTISQSGTNTTHLNIASLARNQDQGTWFCDYGGVDSDSKVLTVLTEPSNSITLSGEKTVNFEEETSGPVEITLSVTCSSPVDVNVTYVSKPDNSSSTIFSAIPLTVENGNLCVDNDERDYTAKFTVSNSLSETDGYKNLQGNTYYLKFTVQLSGGIGKVYEVYSSSNFTFKSASKINKCACTITTVLGGVLGIPFTLLFDTVFMLVIYFAKNKEIIKKCKDKIVLTIVAVCIGVVLSCGIGAGVTSAVMSGKDTGYKSTGCKCAEYIGVLMSLGFSVLGSSVTSVIIYMFVFSRKEDGSVCNGLIFGECFDKLKKTCTCAVTPESKRGPPEGKEDNSENLEKSPDKSEKPTTDHVIPPKHSLLDKVRANRPLPTGRNPAVLLPEVGKENIVVYDDDDDAKDVNDDAPKKNKKRKKKRKVQTMDDFDESKDTVRDENVTETEMNVKREKRRRKKKRNVLKDPDMPEQNYNDD